MLTGRGGTRGNGCVDGESRLRRCVRLGLGRSVLRGREEGLKGCVREGVGNTSLRMR